MIGGTVVVADSSPTPATKGTGGGSGGGKGNGGYVQQLKVLEAVCIRTH